MKTRTVTRGDLILEIGHYPAAGYVAKLYETPENIGEKPIRVCDNAGPTARSALARLRETCPRRYRRNLNALVAEATGIPTKQTEV
jgi:hypothetical protein